MLNSKEIEILTPTNSPILIPNKITCGNQKVFLTVILYEGKKIQILYQAIGENTRKQNLKNIFFLAYY